MTESKKRGSDSLKRQIRIYIQSLLKGKTAAKDRVFINRAVPTQEEELPVILIYSTAESIRRFNEAPKDYLRTMTLKIEVIAQGSKDDDLDGILEGFGDKVEALMELDETLGDLVSHLELTATEYQADSEATNSVGLLALTYSIIFVTEAMQPGADSLDTLEGADVTYAIDEADPTQDATDTINVET